VHESPRLHRDCWSSCRATCRRIWIAESPVSVRPLCTRRLPAYAVNPSWAGRRAGPSPGCNRDGAARRPARVELGPPELHPAHLGTVVLPAGGGTAGQRSIHNRRTRTRGPGGAGPSVGPRFLMLPTRPRYAHALAPFGVGWARGWGGGEGRGQEGAAITPPFNPGTGDD
jgi:hypothetical protein